MTLALLLLAWGFWCLGHSGLISPAAQSFFRKKLGQRFRYFRLCYNGFALATLIPVLWFSHHVQTGLVFSWQGTGLYVWGILWGIVLGLGYAGARVYDLAAFSGMSQAFAPDKNQPQTPDLSRKGILSVIRHPWYLAALILLWVRARNICLSTFLENLLLTLYIFIGIRLEEKKLVQMHGEGYRRYQAQVPALFPFRRRTPDP